MKPYAVMADATCDLGEDIQRQYGIEVIPSHIILPDGRDIPSFHEWKEFNRDQFYADLKKNPEGFTTSPPNVEEFGRVFDACAEKGQDVLLLTISTGISGTYNFALQAKKEAEQRHPGLEIRIIDSLRFGPALGLLTVCAARKRDEGCSLEETAAYVEENKNRLHQAGWLDDLSFVAKKGRMTHAKAFFGTLAGIKPIGEFDYNGLTTVIGKAKGAKAAYQLLMQYIGRTIENPEEQTIVIAHTCRQAQAEMYREMIEREFHPREIRLCDVFPMCGISIGPGLMAAYYMGKPISQGLTEERKIIDEFQAGGKNG